MEALRVPDLCFWPEKSRRNLELFEMHTCLWPRAQIWFRHKWRKLVIDSLLLHCIDGCSYRRCWNQVFFISAACFRLKFSPIALWRKRWQLDSKSDLTSNGMILWFFVGKWLPSLTSYLYGLKSARNAQLLFFFDDITFLRCLGWGVFWSVL